MQADMQAELQHADPYADPHDAIGAQLRDIAPRLAHDPSEFGVMPAASPEPAHAPSLQDISLKDSPVKDSPLKDMPLKDMPLNDNVSDFHDLTPRAGTGRGVALIVCAGIAAAAAWYAYGDEARQRLSNFSNLVPQFLAGAPAQSANVAGSQNAASDTVDSQPAANPAPAQEAAAIPATPAQPATAPASSETPPIQAALPPELAQSIETMTREIASLKQTVEQLQAGQQQLGRDVAKVTEHEASRKPVARAAKPSAAKPAAAPRPQRAAATGAPPRNLGTLTPYSPSPAYSQGRTYPQGHAYPQGTAQRDAYIPPPAPTQLPPQPGDTSVPRPPMPLR
jgi:hypothetical protein